MHLRDIRREQRLALFITAGIGAFFGIVVSYALTSSEFSMCYGSAHGMNWGCLISHYWFRMFFWPVAGAVVGAAIIYVQILMRR